MASKPFTFDLGNRDLTPEEVGVVKKARASFVASAARHGVHIEGGVLIKAISGGSATGVVTRPGAGNIVRQAKQSGATAEAGHDAVAPALPR